MTESGEFRRCFGECELLIDAASEGLRSRTDARRSDSVCIFGTDRFSVVGEMLSDAADELSARPLFCIRDGRVPGWLGADSEAVIVSYEGDCAGMIDILSILRDRGCGVHVLTSGGPLANACRPSELVLLPMGLEGAEAMGYTLGVLAAVVQSTGLFDVADALADALGKVRPDSEAISEGAVALVEVLRGRVGAFYSTSDVHACSVAFREAVSDAGHMAFVGELPEFDHNELVGWSDPNVHAPELTMVILRGSSSSGLVNCIVGCMMEVLGENGRTVVEADIGSGGTLERNLRGLILGLETADLMGVRR